MAAVSEGVHGRVGPHGAGAAGGLHRSGHQFQPLPGESIAELGLRAGRRRRLFGSVAGCFAPPVGNERGAAESRRCGRLGLNRTARNPASCPLGDRDEL